jgi:hypothetical protein
VSGYAYASINRGKYSHRLSYSARMRRIECVVRAGVRLSALGDPPPPRTPCPRHPSLADVRGCDAVLRANRCEVESVLKDEKRPQSLVGQSKNARHSVAVSRTAWGNFQPERGERLAAFELAPSAANGVRGLTAFSYAGSPSPGYRTRGFMPSYLSTISSPLRARWLADRQARAIKPVDLLCTSRFGCF